MQYLRTRNMGAAHLAAVVSWGCSHLMGMENLLPRSLTRLLAGGFSSLPGGPLCWAAHTARQLSYPSAHDPREGESKKVSKSAPSWPDLRGNGPSLPLSALATQISLAAVWEETTKKEDSRKWVSLGPLQILVTTVGLFPFSILLLPFSSQIFQETFLPTLPVLLSNNWHTAPQKLRVYRMIWLTYIMKWFPE